MADVERVLPTAAGDAGRAVSENEPYYLCPLCTEKIDPAEAGVIYAKEQVEVLTMGPTRTIIDGDGGFFHSTCPPESMPTNWARRELPQTR